MPLYRASPIGLSERLPLYLDRPWIGYAASLLAVLVAWAARVALTTTLPPGYPFITFFPAVILCGFFFGQRAGIAAALAGALVAIYFFIPPTGTFHLGQSKGMAVSLYALVVALYLYLVGLLQRATRALMHERDANVRLAETRRLLFHELQHRVSNNLQVVGALLAAQKRRITDESARTAIDEAAHRLTIIGRISRELYRPDGGRAELAEFLPHLADAVFDASGRADITCRFDLPSGLLLDPDRAVPLALVFTEAIANAIEHGYPDAGGTVDVTVMRNGAQRLSLTVADNGRGLPAEFDLDRTDSVGLRIAAQLARQLGGHFSLTAMPDGPGAQARLDIPA